MKEGKKRFLAASLAALMLLSLTSCATPDSNDANTSVNTDAETQNSDDLLYADLPEGNYGGYEFNVLQYKETSAATATVLTERSGTPIEDTIYERALTVEERLGVKFVNNLDTLTAATSRLRNSVAGGLDEYDVFWSHSTTTVTEILANGYLIDLNTIEALDFSKPWWDSTATEYLALDEHTYMAFGDINVYLFDFHSAILFNKRLTDEHRLDLYDMVKNGTWTMHEFIRLSTEMSLPSDGTDKGRYGYAGTALATMFGFLHGADVSLLTYDESGIPALEKLDENYLNVLSTYCSLFKDSAISNPKDWDPVTTFAAQQAAFISCGVGQMGALRDEDFDYGLLPFPKRDAAQKNYISFVTNQIQPMVIPKSATNTERTGVILENLAAESYRKVRPEYFQVLLHSKYVRDPESLENVEILFNSETRFELEHIYNWGGFEEKVIAGLTSSSDSFASSIKSGSRLVNKMIERTLEYLQKGAKQ